MVLLRRIRFSGGISPAEEVAFWRRFPMLLQKSEMELAFFFFFFSESENLKAETGNQLPLSTLKGNTTIL